MAGGGFLSSLITMAADKLHSLVSSSTSSSLSLPHNNIEQEMNKLTETMRRIQAKVADSEEENGVKSHSEKLWLSELKDVAYDAEDVVEEYEYEVLRSKQQHVARESNSGTHEVRNPSVMTFVNNSIIMDELASKAAEIRKKFDEITKEWKLLMLPKNIEKRKRSPLFLVGNRETGPLLVESDVLGREEEKDMLVEWLLSGDDSTGNRVSVIAIIGMGGLGKTTLAQLVYNDHRVKNYFDLTGWVCVSENFDVVGLTEKILQSFTKVKVHEELDGLQHALQEILQGKRFLLVLDDVWNDNFCLWEQLKKPLLWATAGKVIVTTRNHSVARIMETTRHSLNLNVLPFDVCWSLFEKVTLGGADKSLRPDLEDIGRKIVEKCKGLPLAVELIGGALRNEEDEDSWTDIIESEIWELGERNIEVLPALKISYDRMPIQLKRCFQYLSLFPKDTSLYSERIVRLWMSQGLLPLNEDDSDKRAEVIGRNYIKRLAERSMIHLKWDSVLMHDLVHDLARYVAQDECLCVIDNKFDTKKLQKIRHLSVNIEDVQQLKLLLTIKNLQQIKLLRALFIRNDKISRKGCTARQDKLFGVLYDLFQKLKYIRALDLSDISFTELPDSFGNLKLLRYLSIKDTKVESFPESICNLYNLQTLDVQSTNIRELPKQIGNLINLRYLLLPYTVAFLPSGFGNLTSVQRLNIFKVSCENEHCHIGELNSLMKLGGHISIYNVTSLNRFSNSKPPLKTKNYLDSLHLDWLGDFDHFEQDEKNAEWQLEYLEPHVNLKTLPIICYPGVRFVGWMGASSFTKLTYLNLTDCQNCSMLPPLGQLPSLVVLEIRGLDGVEHVGSEFCSMLIPSPSSSQNRIAFPSLKHLEFRRIGNWKAWEGVEIGDFPSLHSIKIVECSKLIKFPRWPSLSSVKEIILRSCAVLDVPNLHSTQLNIDISSQEHGKWMSQCYFPMLQHLILHSKVESVHLSHKQLPSLKTLEIRWSSALRLVTGLKNFTSLNSLIIKKCPNLELDKLPAATLIE